MKYYPVNEEAARRAKEANSFSDYKHGSATSEYQAMVDRAYEVVEKCKATIDPIYHEKLDALADVYARKLAENFNELNVIDARVPSILIVGGGNFPTRKKEKQNAARDKNMREYMEIQELLNKMRSIGKGGISSDDPEAISKLEDKLTNLEQLQEHMKGVNAHYRKYKTLDNCPYLSKEQIKQMKSDLAKASNPEGKPYGTSSNNAEIRRLKERIHTLKENREIGDSEWLFEGGKVLNNTEANRLQILFHEKPSDEQRNQLKKRGFKWTPSQGAWQRQLTANALQAVKNIDFLQPISKV